MSTLRRVAGRVALVTGGGSGIGRATAKRLADEGGAVFVVGRRVEPLDETVSAIRRGGGSAERAALDLTDRAAAAEAVNAAVKWGGRLDILVNCAGAFPYAPFPEAMTDQDWDAALEINLNAPMRLCRAACPALKAARGSIVNVSSINAVMGDDVSKCAHYSAAKAGLLGFTRQLAAELAPEVRVNGVAPGAVDTPMLVGWMDDAKERQAWIDRYVPLKRLTRPEEIASVIAFLASDDASTVTGATIMADGGMTVV
jgi:meso-butanediol dehydrogenase/(S,S)-butanediol dehydrogenase/diacetyl reductase